MLYLYFQSFFIFSTFSNRSAFRILFMLSCPDSHEGEKENKLTERERERGEREREEREREIKGSKRYQQPERER